MMQIMQKWLITLTHKHNRIQTCFYIYDNFYANVLRKLSEISFSDVVKIDIELSEPVETNSTLSVKIE